MKTQVTFRHLDSNNALQEAAHQSIKKFEKFFDGITSTNVEFINEATKQVEFTVQVQGNTLVARDESEDFHKSLNEATDKMIRQIRKWKTKAFKN
jgi:putative sigma-54 modulation protein